MKKFVLTLSIVGIMAVSAILLLMGISQAATDTVALSTTVQEYLSFSITTGDTVAFGNLTPGTPIDAPATGTIASVTTNSANGYTVGLHDSVAASDSTLLHTDAATRIIDYAGTIAIPTVWSGTGLGITLFAADTNKEAKWGTGVTYNDALNNYAGIPQASTVAHTVTGYHAGVDTSSWAYSVDVPNTQKTGAYSGNMTFTATAVLV